MPICLSFSAHSPETEFTHFVLHPLAGITQSPDSHDPFTAAAEGLSAVQAYPYAGLDTLQSILAVALASLGDDSSKVALGALQYALGTNADKIDVLAYSGGAGAFTEAYHQLSASDQQRIGNILYVSPGAAGGLALNQSTSIVRGSGPMDFGAMLGTVYPIGVYTSLTACRHTDFGCMSNSSEAIRQFQAMEATGPCSSQAIFRFAYSSKPSVTSTISYGGGGGNSGSGAGWSYISPTVGEEGNVISPGGWFFIPGVGGYGSGPARVQ